jgi:hypothetical protein
MARPRKAHDEKLIPVKVCLRPDRFDQLDRQARAANRPLSTYLRERLDPRFREPETRKSLNLR